MKIWQLAGLFLYVGIALLSAPQTTFAQAVCDVFTVTPTTAAPGDFVTFDWVTTNTISVDIDVLGTVATSGSALYEVPNIPGVLFVTLTAFDINVFEPSDTTCDVTLTIDTPPTCDMFLASPDTINTPGDVSLEWLTTGADTVSIDNGIGFVTTGGQQTVTVSTSTTYTLTAENTFGTTTCSVPVTLNSVVPPDPEPEAPSSSGSSGGKSINPRCELIVDATDVAPGDTVIATWQAKNAVSVTLESKSGQAVQTLFSTTSPVLSKSGTFPVIVTADTTIRLSANRPNRSTECEVAVTANLGNAGLGNTQGASSLVTLAELPETGFSPTTGFFIIINLFLLAGSAFVAYVLALFWQQFTPVRSRVYVSDSPFVPRQVRAKGLYRSLQSRVLFWQMLAITLLFVGGGYWLFVG
jgi:hypothetical protein